MLPELTSRLLRDWNCYLPELSRPVNICYLGIPGSPEGGTATFLAFDGRAPRPLFVVKTHRGPHASERVKNERDILEYVQSQGGMLALSVPHALFVGSIGSRWVLVQSVIDGRPMPASVTPSGGPDLDEARRNFALVLGWLVELHERTRTTSTEALESVQVRIRSTLQEFIGSFDLEGEERAFVGRLEGNLEDLLTSGLYLQHGDFCRHNVLLASNGATRRIGVIDWTFSSRLGLPLHDLFFFLAGYFVQIRREVGPAAFVRAFEYTFLEKNAYSDLAQWHIAQYCSHLGLDRQKIAAWFGVFLIERAMFELRQVLQCAQQFGLTRLTVYLAAAANKSYREALTQQLWVRYFRFFVREASSFIA